MFVAAAVLLLSLIAYGILFSRSVFVLAYHSIGPEKTSVEGLSIPTFAFQRQLRFMARLGMRAQTIDAVTAQIGTPKTRPVVCITFDDGYRTVLKNALPVLQQVHWPATVFVPTAHVGRTNLWDEANDVPKLGVMSWEELKEISRNGICVGSHGRSHVSMLKLSDDACWAELHGSLSDLAGHLDDYSRVFCYPFGHRRPALASLAKQAGYEGACSGVHDAFPRDRYDLGRIIVKHSSLRGFAMQVLMYPIVSTARRIVNGFRA